MEIPGVLFRQNGRKQLLTSFHIRPVQVSLGPGEKQKEKKNSDSKGQSKKAMVLRGLTSKEGQNLFWEGTGVFNILLMASVP